MDLVNIKSLLDKARVSEGRAAELTAKQEATSGWDVIVGAGAQKDLNDTNTGVKPFVGLTFKWSFGNYGVKDSIESIKSKTEKVFNVSQGGYVKSADRLAEKIDELILIEKAKQELLNNAIEDTQRILLSFKDINTALATNTKKSLELQNLIYSAELAGVKVRLSRYSDIVEKN